MSNVEGVPIQIRPKSSVKKNDRVAIEITNSKSILHASRPVLDKVATQKSEFSTAVKSKKPRVKSSKDYQIFMETMVSKA